MYKFLNEESRQELLDELKVERSRRYADRIRVILLLDDNKTYKSISEYLFLDDGTIANYKKRYREGGLEGLIVDDYKTRRTKLSEFEELELTDEIEARTFLSTKEIVTFIKKKYKVKFSISGCTNLLHRLGFSYKKSKGVPGKAKKDHQEEFIEMYKALDPEAKVYFGDATHPLHNTVLASCWIKTGKEKEVFTNSGRGRVNIFGGVCVYNQEIITRTYQTINQVSVCDFLKVLRAKNTDIEETIYFVLDNGPSNKALAVRELAKKLNIELIFLPPYSPNLNPIERLWKFFKKKILYNQYHEKFRDFKTSCATFFRGIRKYKNQLKSLLTDNFTAVGT
jgi:transposase